MELFFKKIKKSVKRFFCNHNYIEVDIIKNQKTEIVKERCAICGAVRTYSRRRKETM